MGRSNETRPVMGRPVIYPQGRQTVLLSLPAELVPVLKELGGSHWVRDRLREVVAEREKKEVPRRLALDTRSTEGSAKSGRNPERSGKMSPAKTEQ